MKTTFLSCLICLFAISLFAQKNQEAQKKSTKAACCQTVIDIVGINNVVESKVWDPVPVNARTKGVKVTYSVLDIKGNVLEGWNVCDLKKCGTVSWVNQEGKTQSTKRENRRKVDAIELVEHTPVVDLTEFGPGTYVVRAVAGDEVFETRIEVPSNGKAIPKPHDKHMEHKSKN
jgi:hypothetical protein